LLQNPAEMAEIGRRGKAGIEARFTAAAMATATLAMYRKVIAGPGRPAASAVAAG
jgi:hypothetical protein